MGVNFDDLISFSTHYTIQLKPMQYDLFEGYHDRIGRVWCEGYFDYGIMTVNCEL